MTDSSGQSCDVSGSTADANFCTVRTQLLTEFTHVNNIRSFYNNLHSLWLGSGTVTINSQLGAYNDVKAQLNPPPTRLNRRAWPCRSCTCFSAWPAAIPEIGPVFGMADVILNFATELTTDQQGNETIDLTSTIGNLLDQANDAVYCPGYHNGHVVPARVPGLGQAQRAGHGAGHPDKPASPWYWSSSATGQC